MQKILYLGMRKKKDKNFDHHPIIQSKMLPYPIIKPFFDKIPEVSTFIFTSQTSVSFFLEALQHFEYPLQEIQKKQVLSIGKNTSTALFSLNFKKITTTKLEQAEGLLPFLEMPSHLPLFFYPHSSLSRPLIANFCKSKNIALLHFNFYHTHLHPDFNMNLEKVLSYEKIFFTSPSTIDYFFSYFSFLPSLEKCLFQGDVTKNYFMKKITFP